MVYTNTHAAFKDVDCLRFLIEKGANVNSIKSDGETPIHGAALTGSVEGLRLLLGRGANLNAVTSDGCTPIHEAAVLAVWNA
ncbi:hypothetical protein JTB14_020775 [Gonioctena quinquepunctata]|nr:hypothetical protein JTB14_020775 [Gonioctena quinquepunctata]